MKWKVRMNGMDEEKTHCHSDFSIGSKGNILNRIGFVADENSDFDPDYITKKLNIEPYRTRRMGTPRKNLKSVYPFSSWSACHQDTPALDAEEQCLQIVRMLADKIPDLLQIKSEYNVTFTITIVPHIYHEEQPVLYFNQEIIDFCHATGTTIGIDLYIYCKE